MCYSKEQKDTLSEIQHACDYWDLNYEKTFPKGDTVILPIKLKDSRVLCHIYINGIINYKDKRLEELLFEYLFPFLDIGKLPVKIDKRLPKTPQKRAEYQSIYEQIHPDINEGLTNKAIWLKHKELGGFSKIKKIIALGRENVLKVD